MFLLLVSQWKIYTRKYVMLLRHNVMQMRSHLCIRISVSTADVIKAVKRLKTDKCNDDGIIMSNNFQHGTSLLYTRIAQLFSAMLYYGYAPKLFLRSTMISIPIRGRKVCSTNADLYRSIAISSILSKILGYVIIDQQADSLCTSDYQFGFKSHSSTMLCSTMLIETIQYYDENGGQPLYVLFLDASKAFDRVCYSELFNILLDKKVCPRIVQLLCHIYLNQACCVKWNSKNSTDFTVSNGVKQGAVFYSLFSYINIHMTYNNNENKQSGIITLSLYL